MLTKLQSYLLPLLLVLIVSTCSISAALDVSEPTPVKFTTGFYMIHSDTVSEYRVGMHPDSDPSSSTPKEVITIPKDTDMPQELYRWYIEELEDDPDSYYFYLDGAVATSNAVNIYIDPTAVPDADAEIWRIFASPKKDYYTIETKDGFAKWALPNMDDKYVQIQLLSDIGDSQQPLINRQHNHLWSIVHADD